MHVEHTLQIEPKVAKFRPWVRDIVIIVVERPADTTGLLVGIIGGLLLLLIVVIVLWSRTRHIVIVVDTQRGPNSNIAFRGLKIL